PESTDHDLCARRGWQPGAQRRPEPRGEHRVPDAGAQRGGLARRRDRAPAHLPGARCPEPARDTAGPHPALGHRLAPPPCAPGPAAPAAARRWRPSSLTLLFFTLGLVDGLFTVTLSLLLAGAFGLHSALLGAGLLLAGQRLIGAVMSGVGGVFVDRFGAGRI